MARDLLEKYDLLVLKSLRNASDKERSDWNDSRYSVRLKLEGAHYFLQQARRNLKKNRQAGDMPSRDRARWYIEACLFEMMSSFDCLLQEINIVYRCGLKPRGVYWRELTECRHKSRDSNCKLVKKHVKDECVRVPRVLVGKLKAARKREWFRKVEDFRNSVTHHSYAPLSTGWSKNIPFKYSGISMFDVKFKDLPAHWKSLRCTCGVAWRSMGSEFD